MCDDEQREGICRVRWAGAALLEQEEQGRADNYCRCQTLGPRRGATRAKVRDAKRMAPVIPALMPVWLLTIFVSLSD